jgi:DnaJ family protein B protein 4
MGEDYYALLGVPKGTSDPDVLKKAYKKMALKWHPDRHQEEDQEKAKQMFQKISQVFGRVQVSHTGSFKLSEPCLEFG